MHVCMCVCVCVCAPFHLRGLSWHSYTTTKGCGLLFPWQPIMSVSTVGPSVRENAMSILSHHMMKECVQASARLVNCPARTSGMHVKYSRVQDFRNEHVLCPKHVHVYVHVHVTVPLNL